MPDQLRSTLPTLILATVVGFGGTAGGDEPTGDRPLADQRGSDVAAVRGTIAGVVTFAADVPLARVADDAGQRRPLLHVNRKTRALQYAVAYLVTKAGQTERGQAKPPTGDDQATSTAIMDQVEHTFVPHMIAIRSGQSVKFTNSDVANHNVRANSLNAKNEFNIFTGAGGDYRHQFFSDRNRPARLSCDIHPWMTAWVYAFDHPFFAVTDARGRFRMVDLPPGSYELIVRQPDVGLNRQQTVVVQAGEVTHLRIEFAEKDLKAP